MTKTTIAPERIREELGTVDMSLLLEGLELRMAVPGINDVYVDKQKLHYGVCTNAKIRPVLTAKGIQCLEKRLNATYRQAPSGSFYLDSFGVWAFSYVDHCVSRFVLNTEYVEKAAYRAGSKLFVTNNDLKIGDMVKVVRTASSWEGGWDNSWSHEMREGIIGIVKSINNSSGIQILVNGTIRNYQYPYFVLEKVQEEPAKPVLVPAGMPVQPGDLCGSPLLPTLQAYSDTCPAFSSVGFPYFRTPWSPKDYELRQQAWVDFYSLKPGDLVRVCGKAESNRDGWDDTWVPDMDGLVNKTVRVEFVHPRKVTISDDGNWWGLPFYALEPTKRPSRSPSTPVGVSSEPKVRDFKTPDEVLDWVKKHGDVLRLPDGWRTVQSAISRDKDSVVINGTASSFFKGAKSEKDGTPFGVPE